MITWKKLIGIASVLLASTMIVGFSGSTPTMGKIDPMLSLMTMKGANLKVAKSQGIVKSAPGITEPMVGTILRFKGNLAGVESLGGKIRSVIGDIATVDIPLSAVSKIAQLQNIVFIESAKPVKPRLNLSVPETGADMLRSGTPPNWTGATGKGVIIGIVDTGIDLNHADFKDASGKTRVLYLWDQAATTGTPPSGFNYGTYGNECTKAVIDAGGCSAATAQDTKGHGTHVAGIAGGNGQATGNGQAAYRYVGIAPEADLIIVNSLNGVTATNAVVDGIAYIQAKAAALGKPSVINLSLGGHDDPHDGTSSYARALDNATGTGKAIVVCAGNEADSKIHASGTVTQGSSTTVDFEIPAGKEGNLTIWYAGSDQMGISVSNGTCTTSVVNPGSTQSFETSCGAIAISSSDVQAINGDRNIVVNLASGTNPLTTGAWSFTLSGISITNGHFDAWSGDEVATFTTDTDIDTSITLVDGGTATKVITVASYITRPSNGSANDPQDPVDASVGEISSFSSHGPRRSCSDTSNCPSVQKPDITAPGGWIMSAYSANTTDTPDSNDLDADGVHVVMSGTSMATPHVTGAVALLLEAAPTLTSDAIKTILTDNAVEDSFTTGTLPNDTWGYGKMAVAAAYAVTPTNLLPAIPADMTATAGDGQVSISWSPALGATSYNIYWSTTSGFTKDSGTKIDNVTSPYVHTGLTNETTYYYVVTAVNANGESAGSTQVNATTNLTPAPADVTATAGDGQVTVSWSPALGATSYNLYWSATTGVTRTSGTKIANVTSPYVHTGLTNGTTYYYVVTAVNANGESAESTQVNATPTAPSSGDEEGGTYNVKGENSGCFIATAAYGSYLDPHVMTLREFRDNYLLTNAPGQAFVSFYYKISPPIADFIRQHETLRTVTRWTLTPVVYGVKYPMGTLILSSFGVGMVVYRKRKQHV